MGSGLRGIAPASVFARPTADEIWLGPAHASALSLLTDQAGVASISGPPGCGRSLLLQRTGLECARSGALVLAVNGRVHGVRRALSALLADAGINGSHLGAIDQRNLLHVVVGERLGEGRRVLVLVDDVNQIDADVAEELDRLSLFTGPGGERLELRYAFDHAQMDPFIALQLGLEPVSVNIAALDDAALQAYVEWRLERAGLPNLFTRTALMLTRRYTGGVLRGVDSLLRLALLIMRRTGGARVGVQVIDDAARRLSRLREERRNAPGVSSPRKSRIVTGESPGTFIVTEHGAPIMRVPLGRRSLIGRSPSNEICISSMDVSRFHAMVEVVGNRVEIVDLNSANGVWVNGERRRDALLRNGDVVGIGTFKLKLECTEHDGVDRRAANEHLADTVVLAAGVRPPRSHLRSV